MSIYFEYLSLHLFILPRLAQLYLSEVTAGQCHS